METEEMEREVENRRKLEDWDRAARFKKIKIIREREKVGNYKKEWNWSGGWSEKLDCMERWNDDTKNYSDDATNYEETKVEY